MFHVVSDFYEAFYLWCEIRVENFTVASWNAFNLYVASIMSSEVKRFSVFSV